LQFGVAFIFFFVSASVNELGTTTNVFNRWPNSTSSSKSCNVEVLGMEGGVGVAEAGVVEGVEGVAEAGVVKGVEGAGREMVVLVMYL